MLVLPARHRLRDPADFQAVVRRGRRAARGRVVVHLLRRPDVAGPCVGLVVSRAVGNSVVRHRVSRQLRHVAADRLVTLPGDSLIVLRAVPAAAEASSWELAADVDAALAAILRRVSTDGAGRGQSPDGVPTVGGR
jgi:ribonuclease P protein component